LNNLNLIPSNLKYKSAPSVDQKIDLQFNATNKTLLEFDRIRTVNLNTLYDEERQSSTIFRPTFKLSYIYSNKYIGTTTYEPFINNLFYIEPENSVGSGTWVGYPQCYEFDFFRPDLNDQHFNYQSKSAYTYNWCYYITYPFNNNYDKKLYYLSDSTNLNWVAKDGIPFKIKNTTSDGDKLISFECFAEHGLQIGESVELSISYANKNIFEVYSLGNNNFGSEKYIFNVYNVGYTGNTFLDNINGTFKRVANSENIEETKSKYYIRQNKVLKTTGDLVMTKSGFEKLAFKEDIQLELSALTPNNINRVSKKNNNISYILTTKTDIDVNNLIDNQKRPISELFITIINKGYSGYFNYPNNNVGLKQGWEFNITPKNNNYWAPSNINSNTNISINSYTKNDFTFYYNNDLNVGDIIDGDFCEWNDYDQTERVISPYYQKITYNQNVFHTSTSSNPDGYYYQPHNSLKIRNFSNYIETGSVDNIDQVPSYSFYSQTDQEFRWRDLYTYGFVDETGIGQDFPYLNNSHYPYGNVVFKLSPEGINTNSFITGTTIPIKPKIDKCE
jgi:hypothetical protein